MNVHYDKYVVLVVNTFNNIRITDLFCNLDVRTYVRSVIADCILEEALYGP